MVIVSGASSACGPAGRRRGRDRGAAAGPAVAGRDAAPERRDRHQGRQQRRASGHPAMVVRARRRTGLATRLAPRVRRRRPPPADRRRPALGERRAGPDRAGARPAGCAVRGRRSRAGAGRRPGPRRDARAAAQRPRLRHLRAPRRHRAAAARLGRRGLGHGPRLRHHRLPQGATGRSRSRRTAPRATTRPRASRRWTSATPSTGDLGPPRLHRERDGRVGARPRVRRPVRRRGRPREPVAAHARPARGLLLRRPAADAAGRAFRRPARRSPSTPRWSRP